MLRQRSVLSINCNAQLANALETTQRTSRALSQLAYFSMSAMFCPDVPRNLQLTCRIGDVQRPYCTPAVANLLGLVCAVNVEKVRVLHAGPIRTGPANQL